MTARATCLIGVDSGTQSTTACVWTAGGRRLAAASVPLRVRSPQPGWAEQDPRAWWASARSAIRQVLEVVPPARIAAVGVAFQRETFTLADPRGRFLRPGILWLDVRAGPQAAALARQWGAARVHRRTGKPLDVTSAAARLMWLRRHEPECLRRAGRWVDVGAALAYGLTGRHATCVAGADTCGLVGLRSRRWIDAHLHRVGLRAEQMPDLVEPGDVIGYVTAAAARGTGLPRGTPVVAAGGDGQVFSVGVGAARPPGRMSLALGTSVVLGLPCEEAPISPLFRTLIAARPGGGYLLESVIQSGTYLLRWFADRFAAGDAWTLDRWDRQAARVPAGCEGLLTVPNWWGVRFPVVADDARGATLGWSDHHGPAHFYRSLLEGLAFELRGLIDCYREQFARRLGRTIRAGGGGTRSRHWPQILADVTGAAVEVPAERHSTALGAAMLAGVAVGAFADVRAAAGAMVRVCRRLLPEPGRRRLYDALYREVYAPLRRAAGELAAPLRRALGTA